MCNKCMQVCEECLTSCLNEPDVQARVHCIQVLRDCAEICSMASRYMSRNSNYAKTICEVYNQDTPQSLPVKGIGVYFGLG
jgi:hypothetical protein